MEGTSSVQASVELQRLPNRPGNKQLLFWSEVLACDTFVQHNVKGGRHILPPSFRNSG